MTERWTWLIRYAVVSVVALILAAVLGSTNLFNQTHLVGKTLTASHLVRFLGFGGALVILWLAALRTSSLMASLGERWRMAQATVLPLATLIVLASAHPVVLLVVGPLMGKTLRTTFDWIFITGIVGSAGWLLFAMFNAPAARHADDALEDASHGSEATPFRI